MAGPSRAAYCSVGAAGYVSKQLQLHLLHMARKAGSTRWLLARVMITLGPIRCRSLTHLIPCHHHHLRHRHPVSLPVYPSCLLTLHARKSPTAQQQVVIDTGDIIVLDAYPPFKACSICSRHFVLKRRQPAHGCVPLPVSFAWVRFAWVRCHHAVKHTTP